jgi:hypothetical protein
MLVNNVGTKMKKFHFTFAVLLIGVFMFSGCGGNASPSAPVDAGPTVDPNLVFTSGAQTVVAQITLDAASRPVPTAALPATPEASTAATQDPNAASASADTLPTFPSLANTTPGSVLPTAAPLAGAVVTQPASSLPTVAGSLPTVAPAAPVAPAGTVVAAIPDKLQWVSNVPADKSKVPAGKGFKITWKLQNVGTTTWDNTYSFKFYAGTQLAKNGGYPITKEVKPNSTFDFTVDAVAPTTPGDYYSLWVLQRPDGMNVGRFDITLTVQ